MIQSDEAQLVIDNLNTALLLLDSDLRLCGINSAGEDLLSSSWRKVAGQTVGSLLPDFPLLAHTREALDTGLVCTERDVEVCFNGSTVARVDCTMTPVSDPKLGVALILEMNVVDRHRRIAREVRMLSEHNTTNALMQSIAHEIKNPLGGLRGAAQLLERELDNPDHKEYTRVIVGEADRLTKLLDRMVGSQDWPQRSRFNIHEVLEHVRSVIEPELPPGVQILRDYDPSLPDVVGDRDQLIQAQLNIVKNARQALGNQGTIRLRTRHQRQFTIGTKRHKLVVCIEVSDDGPGIPNAIKDAIFYPMITGRPDGTGLGLSIAQSIVQRHGGYIEFSSKPGETTFTTWFPIQDQV